MTSDRSTWAHSVADTPARLFKYMSLGGERKTYARDTVRDGSIYFSSPLQFNDPYDCYPKFDAPASKLTREIRLKTRSNRVKLTHQQRAEVRRRAGSHSREEAIALGRIGFSQSMSKLGIYCLSSDPKSLAMWSHYSDSHRGVCVAFDMSSWPWGDLPLVLPVHYSQERANYDVLCRPEERERMLFSALTQKSQEWRLENEWRVLLQNGASQVIFLAPNVVQAVILGARMRPEDKIEVASWAETSGIDVYTAALDDEKYKLNVTLF